MKRFLILIVLVLAGCGEPSGEDQSLDEIIEQVNASGAITDEQAETLSFLWSLYLETKTAATHEVNQNRNAQWGILTEEDRVEWLDLDGLTSVTDEQAESLSKVGSPIHLCSLTAISDEQAKFLSRLNGLALNSLTSITDLQAESLSKVEHLFLTGLISINEEQAKSLAKVDFLEISHACQPLIDKYKNQ